MAGLLLPWQCPYCDFSYFPTKTGLGATAHVYDKHPDKLKVMPSTLNLLGDFSPLETGSGAGSGTEDAQPHGHERHVHEFPPGAEGLSVCSTCGSSVVLTANTLRPSTGR